MLPTVEPGYIKPLLPDEAPQTPERWEDVMADIERVIMPGVSIFVYSKISCKRRYFQKKMFIMKHFLSEECLTKGIYKLIFYKKYL